MSYARTIIPINSSQTLPVRNEVYLIDGTSGAVGNTGTVVTLPSIVSDGMSFSLRRIDTANRIVTVKGFNNSQTINNNTSITIPVVSDTIVQSYNDNWYTVQGLNQDSYGLPLSFRFTQPNGNGFQTTSNAWIRAGTFIYRGSAIDGPIRSANTLLYTTNTGTWYRARLFDVTNVTQMAITVQDNDGTNTNPDPVYFGTITNIPVSQAVIEIQLLATNSSGNQGISGRQNIGIHSVQLYN